MDKLEKAVKGLECCYSEPETNQQCQDIGCPYYADNDFFCMHRLLGDALEALKKLKKEDKAIESDA